MPAIKSEGYRLCNESIIVRHGKGGKDRGTVLSEMLDISLDEMIGEAII